MFITPAPPSIKRKAIGMVKTGRPKHKQGYKRVTFYLPGEMMDYLKEKGRDNGMSASEYLLHIVLKEQGEKKGE
jgi:hypothetical protein